LTAKFTFYSCKEFMMAKKSKWFRVAIEGATTDGREITRADIVDMAATYNRATYGARVNVEHFRGIIAGGPFDMLGDVLALKSQEDEMQIGGKAAKRMALYAEIQPLDNLVAMNAAGQKIFTSIEIQPDFAKTGKAGLVGLAVTDNPASLGTEVLSFAAKNPDFLAGRKHDADNLFTAALETEMEFFDEDAAPESTEAGKAFASFRNFIDTVTGKLSAEKPKAEEVPAPAAETENASLTAFAAQMGSFAATVEKSIAAVAAAQVATDAKITALTAKLEAEPDPKHLSRRPLATGGDGQDEIIY
jgi:hypothetical protein